MGTTANHEEDEQSRGGKANTTAATTTTTTTTRDFFWRACGAVLCPLRVLLGCTAFSIGACLNCCFETCGAGSKTKRGEWKQAKKDTAAFLRDSGLSEELEGRSNSRLFGNLRLINAIERGEYHPGGRSAAAAFDSDADRAEAASRFDAGDAYRFMKYATAAYGPQVVANAVFESGERVPPGPLAATRPAVMKHIGVPDDNDDNDDGGIVVVMKLAYGEDLAYLRHFCVIDHAHRALVLAIRGTYSASSTMTNCAGHAEEFCGGRAHAGMAKMARGVFEESGGAIFRRLAQLPEDYEFVVVGHSLGAGVAGLFNLLVSHEKAVPDTRKRRCFLYGGPPTFSSLCDAVEGGGRGPLADAVSTTFTFVHKRDVVPYASVHGARRLLHLAAAVDEVGVPLWRKALTDHEFLDPSDEVLRAYRRARAQDLSLRDGAPALYIPARAVVWIEPDPRACCCANICADDSYHVTFCDPQKLVDVGPLVTPGGISDHLTGRYEKSLKNVHC